MKIAYNDNIPDYTYFTASDVMPEITSEGVTIYQGKGTHRSWGSPSVTASILVNTRNFLAIHIGFSHKHRGGQFFAYFVRENKEITRKIWSQLTLKQQKIVFGGYKEKAAGWAKMPGVLKSEKKKPSQNKFLAYKILIYKSETEFESVYDWTSWNLGKNNIQKVSEKAGYDLSSDRSNHSGGYYVYKDAEKLLELFDNLKLFPKDKFDPSLTYALVECECMGRTATFPNSKIAVTYCKPIRLIKTFKGE